MAAHWITHTRPDGRDPDRRIDGLMVGGTVYSIDTIIAWIERNLHQFYVKVAGRQTLVVVRQHGPFGRKYLTTMGDNFPPNNLLNLPRC